MKNNIKSKTIPKEEYIQKLNDIQNKHIKKYGFKKMSKKELVKLFG
ncbi:hypothetical protein GW835_01510 [archaeon]|nr:hypothetical protein [archaeon]NCP79225.1 hypothetical protein [archaeon]NCP97828.1 hypothetical protein [archaeon]NCQ06992.1 hypothetical protein [archaeon]NCQ50788.1 hypothetical protein [archaeon]